MANSPLDLSLTTGHVRTRRAFRLAALPMAINSNLRGALLSLGAFFAYACTDVSIKALGQNMSSFQVMFLAAACTLPFVAAQIIWKDHRASLWPRMPGITVLRILISLIGSAFVT